MKCGIGKKQLKISLKKGQVLYLTVYGVRIKETVSCDLFGLTLYYWFILGLFKGTTQCK